jgi:hypothetical protein
MAIFPKRRIDKISFGVMQPPPALTPADAQGIMAQANTTLPTITPQAPLTSVIASDINQQANVPEIQADNFLPQPGIQRVNPPSFGSLNSRRFGRLSSANNMRPGINPRAVGRM